MKKQPSKTALGQEIINRLQEFADALDNGDVLAEKFTCRTVEVKLQPTPYNPGLLKKTRTLLQASQATFAHFLGVSVQTVRAWEQGENVPSGIARRFMDEIRHDPDYWRKRLRAVVVPKRKKTA